MKSMLQLCEGMPRQQFEAQACVLTEGVQDGGIYVLIEGHLEILKGEHVVNRVSDPGAIFGEISVLLDQPASATVRCLEPSAFLVAADGHAFLQAHPEACWHVARVLAQRLNRLTHYLVDLKEQFGGRQDHLGMVDEVLESLLQHQARPPR